MIVFVAVSGASTVRPASVAGPTSFDQAEVDHLDQVRDPAAIDEEDVPGLDVAVDEPGVVRLGERRRGLGEDVDDPSLRLRPVGLDHLWSVAPSRSSMA